MEKEAQLHPNIAYAVCLDHSRIPPHAREGIHADGGLPTIRINTRPLFATHMVGRGWNGSTSASLQRDGTSKRLQSVPPPQNASR